ncbi:MAG: helix-turn-helix domain-containing protein [Candidatus Shapirobacteria bacterium]
MNLTNFLSTPQLAKLLGISRVAVYQKIKAGQIPAVKIGRNFVIAKSELGSLTGDSLTDKEDRLIRQAVKKTIADYGETLKLLAAYDQSHPSD